MTRAALGLLLVLSLAPCVAGQEDLAIRVDLETTEVELGMPFSVTVVRRWSADLEPVEWSENALAPLLCELLEMTRVEEGGSIEETLLYRCHAFSLGDVLIKAPTLQATPRDEGDARSVTGDPLVIKVVPLLDPVSPGEVEFPEGPLEEPPGNRLVLLLLGTGLVILVAMVIVLRRRRGETPVAPSAPPAPVAPPAHVRALERLRRLGKMSSEKASEIQSYYVEATDLLREYLGERFHLPATEQTTRELLADSRTGEELEQEVCALLRELLAHADLVKFAALPSTRNDRERLLAMAETFLERTRASENGHAAAPRSEEDKTP
jgi:hypothetical protein